MQPWPGAVGEGLPRPGQLIPGSALPVEARARELSLGVDPRGLERGR